MPLAIRHRTLYRYDPPVASVAMRVKLFPSTMASQRPLEWRVTAAGRALAPEFRNGWGDDEATLLVFPDADGKVRVAIAQRS